MAMFVQGRGFAVLLQSTMQIRVCIVFLDANVGLDRSPAVCTEQPGMILFTVDLEM